MEKIRLPPDFQNERPLDYKAHAVHIEQIGRQYNFKQDRNPYFLLEIFTHVFSDTFPCCIIHNISMVAYLCHFVSSHRKAKGEDTKTCLFVVISTFGAKTRKHEMA